jgi:hypothetical protein
MEEPARTSLFIHLGPARRRLSAPLASLITFADISTTWPTVYRLADVQQHKDTVSLQPKVPLRLEYPSITIR